MNQVTRILCALKHGNPHAAEELLPLVYELNPQAAEGTGPRMMAVNANLEGLNSVIQAGSSLATAPPVAATP